MPDDVRPNIARRANVFEFVPNYRVTIGGAQPVDDRQPHELEADKIHANFRAKLAEIDKDPTLSDVGKADKKAAIRGVEQAKLDAIFAASDAQRAADLEAANRALFSLTGSTADRMSALTAAAAIETPDQALQAVRDAVHYGLPDLAAVIAERAHASSRDPLAGERWAAAATEFAHLTNKGDALGRLRGLTDRRRTATDRMNDSIRRRLPS